jgi:TolB-like protein
VTDTPSERDDQGAWARLRRRKLVRWSLAYAAGAWALLQVIGFLVDAFHWPDGSKQVATLALLTGLPIAMVIAWYHGDRGEQRATRTELTLIVVLLLLGGALVWRWGPPMHAERGEMAAGRGGGGRTPTAAAADDLSVAVLPFVNMSSDPEQEYFSDGLAEEILNALAKVPQLRVIGRTSSFQFKGRNEDLRIIGEKLGSAHLLEGSVRRSGQQVRITAQLIRVADGSHLWSETYDRGVQDIFEVQRDIAQQVTAALQQVLGGETAEARVKAATSNMTAYDLYLEGRYLFNTRALENISRGLQLLKAATERDPSFAEAHATFAVAVMVSRDYPSADPQGFIPITQAERSAHRALELDPALAEAHAALGMIHASRLEWGEADEEFRNAIADEPHNAMANMWYGNFLRGLGRIRAALPFYETARHFDPQASVALGNLAISYAALGRIEDAERLLDFARDRGMRHPTFCIARIAIGTARGDQGMVQAALGEWFSFFTSWMPAGAEVVLARAAFDPGARADARRLLVESIQSEKQLQSWATLLVAALAGDFDTAFASASFVSLSGAVSWGGAIWHPSLAAWRADPRFGQLVVRLQMPAYWRAAGWPDFCRPVSQLDFECHG